MTNKRLWVGLVAVLSLVGCRDHRDGTFDRLGDHDLLAGRSAPLGDTSIGDADLMSGFIHARSSFLVPLRDTLRAQLGFHMELFGDVEIGIPDGFASGYDPMMGFSGTRGRRTSITTPSTVRINVDQLGVEYEQTCLVQHLSAVAPVLWGGDRPCRMLNLERARELFDGVTVDVVNTMLNVAWVAPDTSIGENARNPVLEIVLPTTINTDPKDWLPIDPTWTVDLAIRIQVAADTSAQRVRFERYRHDRPELGDARFSDAGVALEIRVVHRNLTGGYNEYIEPVLNNIDRIAATLLGRLISVPVLDNAQATTAAWDAWCADRFGTCPITSGALAQIAAHSQIWHGDTRIQLPPRSDDPAPAVRRLTAPGGVWTNDTIHALAEGATVLSATFDRSTLATRCTADYATSCTGGAREAFCVACEECTTPPAGAGALCDFATPLAITMSDGSGIPGMQIAPAPAFAKLLDAGPGLGTELHRVFNRPVDNYRTRTGDNLRYSDVLFCPGVAECPVVPVAGAVFVLDLDHDDDGVSFGDNCPHVPNPDQANADGDELGDACDGCPHVPSTPADLDADGLPDACDCDRDGDTCNNEGVDDAGATCEPNGEDGTYDDRPAHHSARRAGMTIDLDEDGYIDDCDPDDDGDDVTDVSDNCPRVYNPDQSDINGNGLGDACDPLCSSASTCRTIDVIKDAAERIYIPWIDLGLDPIGLCLVDGPRCMIWWSIDVSTGDLVGRSGFDREAARVSPKQLGLPDLAGGIARIPDLDGDGLDDLAVASPDVGVVVGLGSAKHDMLFQLSPLSADAEFGVAMARVGSELWIGAPGQRDALDRMTGAVLRYEFRNGELAYRGVVFGETDGERFGAHIADVGGQRVVIGAPAANGPYGKLAGRFDVLAVDGGRLVQAFGPADGAGAGSRAVAVDKAFGDGVLIAWPAAAQGAGVIDLYDASGARKWRVTGGAGYAIGTSLVSPLDLDGDGSVHAVFGAPGFAKGAGAVLALDPSGKLSMLVHGNGHGFASELVAPGDLDGDGLPELGVAAPKLDGALIHLSGGKH